MAMREAKPAASEAASSQLAGRFCIVHFRTCFEVRAKAPASTPELQVRSVSNHVLTLICPAADTSTQLPMSFQMLRSTRVGGTASSSQT